MPYLRGMRSGGGADLAMRLAAQDRAAERGSCRLGADLGSWRDR